jgi:hypothetical protein
MGGKTKFVPFNCTFVGLAKIRFAEATKDRLSQSSQPDETPKDPLTSGKCVTPLRRMAMTTQGALHTENRSAEGEVSVSGGTEDVPTQALGGETDK